MNKNPYNPSFGQKPERFLGRSLIVYEILSSLTNPNSPWRTTLLIGVRGSGKTALLSDIRESITDCDTISVFVTPENDILNDILSQVHANLPKSLIKSIPKPSKLSVGSGVEFDLTSDSPAFLNNFRYQLTTMLEALKKKETKLMLLIDETQKHSSDMRTFIATYQHLLRERFDVHLVMAGLPNVISDILNDDVLTFLRRANQVVLDNVDVTVVAHDFQEVFCKEFNLSSDTVERAAFITRGYPYLIQLMGFYLWEYLRTGTYESDALIQATVQAKSMMFQNVHKLLYRELSPADRDFVFAMTLDNSTSRFADIITRTEKSKQYLSAYRLRLIDRGYIKAVARGEIAFCLPFTKEFLQQEMALAEL